MNICPKCFTEYNLEYKLPRILPDCGHTFCTECLISFNEKHVGELKCPEDNIPISSNKSPSELPKNMAIIKHIEKLLKEKKETNESKKICTLHKKKKKIICLTCREIICSKCAIFSIHREHDLKMEDEMKKEITQRGESLLELYNLIKQNEQIIKKDDIDAIYMKFKDKVKELRTDIERKFKEMYDLVKQREAKLNEQLQNDSDKLESKLNILKDYPKQLTNKLQAWKNIAKSKLEKLPEIEKQIEIGFDLLEDKDQANDVLVVGVKLLEQLSSMKSDVSIDSIHEIISKFSLLVHPQYSTVIHKLCYLKSNEQPEDKNEETNLLEGIDFAGLLNN